MLFVPPKFTKDAVFEALDAGIKKICTIADGIPLHEAIQIRRAALSCGAMVVGRQHLGHHLRGRSHARHHPLLD